MNENIKKLLQKVAADESLQEKMQSLTNMDDAYAFASSLQDGFTKEEFVEVMAKLRESASADDELTDDDLAGAAGGLTTGEAVSVGIGTGVGAVAVTAGAASAAAG